MNDLLPCPFCGGQKLLITTNEHGGFCLTCENCDAIGPPSEYDPAQMREAWNTRADHVDSLLKAEREKALREAAHYHHHFLRDNTDLSIGKVFRSGEAILSLISKDKTDG